jgi:uncharacterized membrane protein YjjB (DUF3815 family)
MIFQTISAGFVTLGFAIMFNIRGRHLLYTSICGSMSWLVYLLAKQHGCSEYMSYFIATMMIALYSEIGARVWKTPVTTLLIAALIPMAPGGGIYRTMVSLINERFAEAAKNGMVTFGIAGSMAMGIVIVSTLFNAYSNFKRGSIPLFEKFRKKEERLVTK